MRKNRLTSLLLAFLLLTSSLAACSDNTNDAPKDNVVQSENTDTPSADDTTETEPEIERIKPDIPESADMSGDEIRFLHWDHSGWATTVRRSRDIYSEGINGEAINDTVYNRNIKIEDAYNVKIVLELMDLGLIVNSVNQSVAGGDNTYDVVYPRLYEAPSLYQNGSFHNINSIAYIDTSKPWWDSNCASSMDCKGYLPAIAGSLNVNDKDATAAVAFNKDIAKNNNLEDFYTIVREGTWTYDTVSKYSEAVYLDMNGDGTMMPDDDVYGLLGGNDVMDSFWHGSGSLLADHDSEGGFTLTFGSERDITSAIEVVNLMNQVWFMNHHTISNTDDIYYRQLFETGHGLFFWMRLDDVTNMRAGEADFGILPTPKYEETQDKYYNLVSQHTTGILSVPITQSGEELSNLGLILEALAAESHYTLIPEYIEVSLKTKNSRDSESADMLDIVISNRVFDPMNIYNFGNFANSFINLASNNNTDIASFLQKQIKPVTKQIEKTTEAMLEKVNRGN